VTTTWRGWRWTGRRWIEVCSGLSLDATARVLTSLCKGVKDRNLAICPREPTWSPKAQAMPLVQEVDRGT
jgi:hypothetical protein